VVNLGPFEYHTSTLTTISPGWPRNGDCYNCTNVTPSVTSYLIVESLYMDLTCRLG
jgi:hypothetical protein